MSYRSIIGPAALAAMLVLGSTAEAATLSAIEGHVMVNNGYGYQAVSSVMELNPGDLVMAAQGGSARLSFADGCLAVVQPGAVVAIGQQSPCVTQVQAQSQQGSPGGQGNSGGGSGGGAPGAGGVGGGVGGLGGGGFGVVPGALAVGVGIVGGVVGAVVSATQKPASP